MSQDRARAVSYGFNGNPNIPVTVYKAASIIPRGTALDDTYNSRTRIDAPTLTDFLVDHCSVNGDANSRRDLAGY